VTPLTPKGLRASLPAPAAPDLPVRARDVVVTVFADAVLLNHERLSIPDLGLRLARLYTLRGDTTIFVRGDKALEFRQVAQALDGIHGAGMTRLALMTAN
jgi:biopolymer transport protein ExbD